MDNALVVDGAIAVVLLAGALIGAYRGLFKSLMGFVAAAAALVGAVVLANVLTPLVTELVYPYAREAALTLFAAAQNADAHGFDLAEVLAALEEQLGRFGLSASGLNPAISALTLAEQAAKALIGGLVHAVLLVLLFLVLLVLLRLVTGAVGHVFDLPVLNVLNGAGGAAFGLLEAAALLFVAVYVMARFGVTLVTGHMQDTLLLPLLMRYSPVDWITLLTRTG